MTLCSIGVIRCSSPRTRKTASLSGDEQTSGPPLLPVGVPRRGGLYTERLNTDSQAYGGSNVGNAGAVMAAAIPCHGRPFSLDLILPPLATLVLVPQSGI